MRANLGADAVFERRDDLAARRVVLGIRAEDEGDIERQANRISLNLHIAFLHDVEERDLDFSREIGQLIDGEDAAVGARQQAIVHRELAREVLIAAGRLDGVDVADEVGYGDIRSGELFNVTVVARKICDGRVVAEVRDQVAATLADRAVRIVANLAAGDVWQLLIEQGRQRAQDAALRLPAQAEQDEVLPRENRIDDLRNDGVFDSPRCREKESPASSGERSGSCASHL